jgi:anaerobic selenocysteine-containing dehydrogenase
VNCGSRCPLRMHVVDGEIKYVETDNTGDDNYDGCIRFAPVCAAFDASPRL